MTDFLSPPERSIRMAKIRGRDTAPEIALRQVLHRVGLRYRLHDQRLPGSPDLVFRKYKAVVFVHGCFWHRHPGCKIASTPKTNSTFWQEKFKKNQERDLKVHDRLETMGWKVFVVWECELNSTSKAKAAGETLAKKLSSLLQA